MKRLNTQEGFTLVELAIVMTIIGLLIGGILKGQELMTNARVTAEVAQVKGISAAMTTFKDMFNATPGDMTGAGTRLVGCPGALGVNCNPLVGNPGRNPGAFFYSLPRVLLKERRGNVRTFLHDPISRPMTPSHISKLRVSKHPLAMNARYQSPQSHLKNSGSANQKWRSS
jgi:prepilin-type N-terminal cleavage/methylation domain-containing protein